jgi:hypothetical protein
MCRADHPLQIVLVEVEDIDYIVFLLEHPMYHYHSEPMIIDKIIKLINKEIKMLTVRESICLRIAKVKARPIMIDLNREAILRVCTHKYYTRIFNNLKLSENLKEKKM